MSVVNVRANATFTVEQILWSQRELIDALIAAAMANQAEASIDMLIDCVAPDNINRDRGNQTLQSVPAAAKDFLNDALTDLRVLVDERLESILYSATVTAIKYELDGAVSDIDVTVSVG